MNQITVWRQAPSNAMQNYYNYYSTMSHRANELGLIQYIGGPAHLEPNGFLHAFLFEQGTSIEFASRFLQEMVFCVFAPVKSYWGLLQAELESHIRYKA